MRSRAAATCGVSAPPAITLPAYSNGTPASRLPRGQPALEHLPRRRDGRAGADDVAREGDLVAQRAEVEAAEDAADVDAEGQRRRARARSDSGSAMFDAVERRAPRPRDLGGAVRAERRRVARDGRRRVGEQRVDRRVVGVAAQHGERPQRVARGVGAAVADGLERAREPLVAPDGVESRGATIAAAEQRAPRRRRPVNTMRVMRGALVRRHRARSGEVAKLSACPRRRRGRWPRWVRGERRAAAGARAPSGRSTGALSSPAAAAARCTMSASGALRTTVKSRRRPFSHAAGLAQGGTGSQGGGGAGSEGGIQAERAHRAKPFSFMVNTEEAIKEAKRQKEAVAAAAEGAKKEVQEEARQRKKEADAEKLRREGGGGGGLDGKGPVSAAETETREQESGEPEGQETDAEADAGGRRRGRRRLPCRRTRSSACARSTRTACDVGGTKVAVGQLAALVKAVLKGYLAADATKRLVGLAEEALPAKCPSGMLKEDDFKGVVRGARLARGEGLGWREGVGGKGSGGGEAGGAGGEGEGGGEGGGGGEGEEGPAMVAHEKKAEKVAAAEPVADEERRQTNAKKPGGTTLLLRRRLAGLGHRRRGGDETGRAQVADRPRPDGAEQADLRARE